MVEKILKNTTPYGKIRASHEGSLHSSTLSHLKTCAVDDLDVKSYTSTEAICEFTLS